MKDIKIKDTKKADTIRTKVSAPVKAAEHAMRESALDKIKTMGEVNRDNNDNSQNYAIDKTEQGMENAEYVAEKTAIKTKDYAVRKAKEHYHNKKAEQTFQNAENITPEHPTDIKTRENAAENTPIEIKTNSAPKEQQIKQAISENQTDIKVKGEVESGIIKVRPTEQNIKVVDNNSGVPIKTRDTVLLSENKADIDTRQAVEPKLKDNVIKDRKQAMLQTDKKTNTNNSAPTPKDIQIRQYTKQKQEKLKADKISAEKQSVDNYDSDIKAVGDVKVEDIKVKNSENMKMNTDTIKADISSIKVSENPVDSHTNTVFDIKTKASMQEKSIANGNAPIKTKEISVVYETRLKNIETEKVRLRSKNISRETVKRKNIFSANEIKTKKVVAEKKAKKKLAKTPAKIAKEKAKAEVKKKAMKEAAQKAAQVTKQTAKVTAKVIKETARIIAQAVAKAVAAIASAVTALGGWVVLLILLIVVIIVAAIAASPFGIFFSDENAGADTNSIPLSSIVAECNMELSAKLDDIENTAAADRSEIIGEQANWDLVLAVFATKVAGVEDDTVEDVVVITEEKKQKLKDVFWDMHEITSRTETVTNGETSEKVIYITINTKTKDDMIAQYGFTRKQQEALDTLLEQDEVLISATHSLAISDRAAQDILKNLPDSLSPERKKVIKAACSLVGKVNYFWGGKSSAIGWDSEWGKLKTVSAEGSKTTGTKRPFGLDCSGFVTWSFINSGFSASAIGHGTQGQIAKCSRISWSQAQAGDLAFLSDLSHVGIIAGKDTSGNILVIHCSGGANNVVITSNSIFGFAARPSCY